MSETLIQSQRAVHVGGLAEDILESTIRAAFIPFGPIQSIDIPMDYAKGRHKGFCFIEYQDADDATECIFNMDGSELMGKVLTVNLAQPTQLTQAQQGDKAVWSTEEWFQQQQQGEEKTVEPTDAVLKEQGPLVAK
jgi:RNA recognition motif-containing protein